MDAELVETDQLAEEDLLLYEVQEDKQRATDQLAEEEDLLLYEVAEEEQRTTDQLAEEEDLLL